MMGLIKLLRRHLQDVRCSVEKEGVCQKEDSLQKDFLKQRKSMGENKNGIENT